MMKIRHCPCIVNWVSRLRGPAENDSNSPLRMMSDHGRREAAAETTVVWDTCTTLFTPLPVAHVTIVYQYSQSLQGPPNQSITLAKGRS